MPLSILEHLEASVCAPHTLFHFLLVTLYQLRLITRAIRHPFNEVDSRYYTWDSETLQSKLHSVSYNMPYTSRGNLDAGYLIAQAFLERK